MAGKHPSQYSMQPQRNRHRGEDGNVVHVLMPWRDPKGVNGQLLDSVQVLGQGLEMRVLVGPDEEGCGCGCGCDVHKPLTGRCIYAVLRLRRLHMPATAGEKHSFMQSARHTPGWP